jgi:hypothetical protein
MEWTMRNDTRKWSDNFAPKKLKGMHAVNLDAAVAQGFVSQATLDANKVAQTTTAFAANMPAITKSIDTLIERFGNVEQVLNAAIKADEAKLKAFFEDVDAAVTSGEIKFATQRCIMVSAIRDGLTELQGLKEAAKYAVEHVNPEEFRERLEVFGISAQGLYSKIYQNEKPQLANIDKNTMLKDFALNKFLGQEPSWEHKDYKVQSAAEWALSEAFEKFRGKLAPYDDANGKIAFDAICDKHGIHFERQGINGWATNFPVLSIGKDVQVTLKDNENCFLTTRDLNDFARTVMKVFLDAKEALPSRGTIRA